MMRTTPDGRGGLGGGEENTSSGGEEGRRSVEYSLLVGGEYGIGVYGRKG